MRDRPLTGSTARGRGDAGSVLMLMPAAVLILVLLGALAVDFAALHLAKRELASIAAGAANDAVTAGLDVERFRQTGDYALDEGRIRAVVARRLEAQPPTAANEGALVLADLTVDGTEVRIVFEQRVEPIFGRAVPGSQAMTVRATATASAIDASGS